MRNVQAHERLIVLVLAHGNYNYYKENILVLAVRLIDTCLTLDLIHICKKKCRRLLEKQSCEVINTWEVHSLGIELCEVRGMHSLQHVHHNTHSKICSISATVNAHTMDVQVSQQFNWWLVCTPISCAITIILSAHFLKSVLCYG